MFEWSVDAGLFKCAEKRIGVCFFQPLHVRHEGSRTYNSQKSLTDKTLLLLLSFVCQCIFIHPCLHPRVFSPAVALYPSLSVFFFLFFPLPVLGWPVLMFLFGSRSPPHEQDAKESR